MAVVKPSNKLRKPGAGIEREGRVSGPARPVQARSDLHVSNRSSFLDMSPGDIVFLDDFAYLRDSFAANFVAVLACPLCGSPGLITSTQYMGGAPIVCTSTVCSGQFQMVSETQIVALPPN